MFINAIAWSCGEMAETLPFCGDGASTAGETLFAGVLEQILVADETPSGFVKTTLAPKLESPAPQRMEDECREEECLPSGETGVEDNMSAHSVPIAPPALPAPGESFPAAPGPFTAFPEPGFAKKARFMEFPVEFRPAMDTSPPIRIGADDSTMAEPLHPENRFQLPPPAAIRESAAVPIAQDPAEPGGFLSLRTRPGGAPVGPEVADFGLPKESTPPVFQEIEIEMEAGPVRPAGAMPAGEDFSRSPVFLRENRAESLAASPRSGKDSFAEVPLVENEIGPAPMQQPSVVSRTGTEPAGSSTFSNPLPGAVRESLLEQLGGRILYLRERGDLPAEMRLQLNPPELGRVAIKVSEQNGRLAVQFTAEAPVQKLLESCLGELQLRLPQADFAITRLVSPGGPDLLFSSGAGPGNPDRGRNFPDQSGGEARLERHRISPETVSSLAEMQPGSSHRGINYWA